jgi:hypothetical protein
MRSSAFFINGGAGRVISSIPALELFEKENPEDDFIIVCEAGMDMFKNHPTLHSRCFDVHHKGLFEEKIKDRNCISAEPYRVWEYYNQKCSLAQAFDIIINQKDIRELSKSTIVLNTEEDVKGFLAVKEVKEKTKKDKVVVFQPFGRSSVNANGFVYDSGGRSFDMMESAEIVSKLQEKGYAIMMMSEFQVPFSDLGCKEPVSHPQNIGLREWAGIIKNADHFLGCDSVGQHIAHSLDIPTTVVLGSTFAINTSYVNSSNVDIIDIDTDIKRYSPIRITFDEEIERSNDKCMKIGDRKEIFNKIYKSIETRTPVKKKTESNIKSLPNLSGLGIKNGKK